MIDPSWPASRIGEAIGLLGWRIAGSPPATDEEGAASPAFGRPGPDAIERLAARAGLEAEWIGATYAEACRGLRDLGPSLIWIPARADEPRFLLVLGSADRGLRLVAPDRSERTLLSSEERSLLCEPLEAPFEAEIARTLEAGMIEDPARRRRVRSVLIGERLGSVACVVGYALRLPPGASPIRQARDDGLLHRLGAVVAAHALRQVLLVAAFWAVGRGALEGRLDPAWLWAFALLLLTMVPLTAAGTWSQAVLAVGASRLLKRRLLAGALRLEPDEIRREGSGQLLGRVLESENVEALALAGGFEAVLSSIEILLATWVLSAGVGGGLHVTLIGMWLAGVLLAARHLYGIRRAWTRSRVDMSDRLVERMVGHRTRLAQEPAERWHAEEDADLETYYELSRRLDRQVPRLEAFASRGFLVAALLAVSPALVQGDRSPAALAVTIGGVLLGAQALQRLVAGLSDLLGAAIGWRQVSLLFRAASRPVRQGSPAVAGSTPTGPGPDDRVLEGRALCLRYPNRSRPALRDVGFVIRPGERVLVGGRSGSGKSTLAALLAGLRRPDSGLLLLRGLDASAWGDEAWRRRVVLAPQFHENHIIAAPLAFNLLLGRGWPPSPADLRDAEEVCRDLGLEPLLAKMPGGLFQPVGETGWQLSHGERGRVFLARTLLQASEAAVLDESFGALDPETVRQAVKCARERAPTLIVVSHP